MKKHTFRLIDTNGNAPVRSEYTMPLSLSANAPQHMMFATTSCVGNNGSGRCTMFRIGCKGCFDVLRNPFGGFFMWPLAVAVLGGRYFVTSFSEMFGHPLRNPALIALSNVERGGLHSAW